MNDRPFHMRSCGFNKTSIKIKKRYSTTESRQCRRITNVVLDHYFIVVTSCTSSTGSRLSRTAWCYHLRAKQLVLVIVAKEASIRSDWALVNMAWSICSAADLGQTWRCQPWSPKLVMLSSGCALSGFRFLCGQCSSCSWNSFDHLSSFPSFHMMDRWTILLSCV